MNQKKEPVYIIKNHFLRAKVSSLGAELVSLYDFSNSRELIWQGNADVWPCQAPVLFPLVGRLKTEEFTYEGKRYGIGIHGFARFMEFSLSEQTGDAVSFTLVSSAQTRKQYPFDFEFTVRYSLDGSRLLKEHIVTNTSEGEMYYEVGGHEGYRLPLTAGEKMSDFYLVFPNKNALFPYVNNSDKMLLNQKHTVDLEGGRLFLHMDVFANDALILDDEAGKVVELHGPKTGRILTVYFPDFKYLGVWTKYLPFDTNYVCIEPWSSLPDFLHLGHELTEKIGIRRLAPRQSEILSYSVSVD